MRITGLGLQADLDRQLTQLSDGNASPSRLFANPQHVLFVDVEINPDRIELHDGGKLGRRRGRADEFADRDQMGGDDTVERCRHIGVTVIDLGDPRVDLSLLQIRLRVVAVRRRLIERGLRHRLALHQIRLALEIGFRLLERRLRTDLGRLRLVELQLVGLGLDGEQRGALLDEGAVLVIDRLQEALHARDEIDTFDRGGIARGVEEARDGALHRLCDCNLRGRRRHESILFAAT